MPNELPPEKLRKEIDPKIMRCKTTDEIPPLEGIIGQERAVRALRFGLDIKERGFNIYVAGYPGTGRMTAVRDFLEEIAKSKPVPNDWCYVNNFSNPYEPKAIKLPPRKGMQRLEPSRRKGRNLLLNSTREPKKRDSLFKARK